MTGDNSDTTLTLSVAPVSENNVQVYFDGVYQSKANYSISGTTLTFSTAPATGVAVEAISFTQTSVNAPTNDSVATATIQDGAVTAAKLASGVGGVAGIVSSADATAITIDSSENVGIGTSSPSGILDIKKSYSGNTLLSRLWNSEDSNAASNAEFRIVSGNAATPILTFGDSGAVRHSISVDSSDNVVFKHAGSTERMKIDSSGNVVVGATSFNNDASGIGLGASNFFYATRSGGLVSSFNRLSSDGVIVDFRKNSSAIGSINASSTGGGSIIIGNDSSGIMFRGDLTGSAFIPANPSTNAQVDNSLDIGHSAIRFDDIYATNATIQTSDRNEKQDIEALTDAETRVAVAAKGLLRKFRWQSAVEEKGDEARIHFGIIAQDLQDAFTAEGLDASDYAMFISTTWWETQTEVAAVEAVEEVTDEEGNVITEAVEAKDAYTRIDTYNTAEEAPEGATERSRLGVRYSELLAFIIAAI
jgi:hypothetical protein